MDLKKQIKNQINSFTCMYVFEIESNNEIRKIKIQLIPFPFVGRNVV